MTSGMQVCPISGLYLPKKFIDEKQSLKKSINDLVENVVRSHGHIKGTYFLTIHAKFDPNDPTTFRFSEPKLTKKIPQFLSNTFVYWVSNERGIKEMLWMVPPKKKGEKLAVEFNKSGVAYLQAKGAMPS